MDRIQQSLKVVRSSLQPVLEVMEGLQNNFAMVSTGNIPKYVIL